MINKILATITASMLLSACATAPEKIAPTIMSSEAYSDFDCNQVRQELLRVHERVTSIAGMQRTKAKADAIAVGVGIALYWPALFLVAGGDMDVEIASLKGQYDALATSAVEKRCPVAAELGLSQSK